jgi:hypothetical protein
MITLDFDVEKEAAGMPDDTYEFEIIGLENKPSSAGNPMISLTLSVVNHPDYNGRKIYDNITLLPQTAFRIHNLCKALDVNAQNIPDSLDEARQLGWLDTTVFAKTKFDTKFESVKVDRYVAAAA